MKKEKKIQLKKLYMIIGCIVCIIVFLDQLSKFLIINYQDITVIPNIFVLKVSEMQNATYDDTEKAVSIITHILIMGIIFRILNSNNQFISKKTKILLSFAFAGGISNILDRIFRGGVVEFIDFIYFPAFNIADICIVVGWVSFVAIFTSFSSRELSNRKQEKEERRKEKKTS